MIFILPEYLLKMRKVGNLKALAKNNDEEIRLYCHIVKGKASKNLFIPNIQSHYHLFSILYN